MELSRLRPYLFRSLVLKHPAFVLCERKRHVQVVGYSMNDASAFLPDADMLEPSRHFWTQMAEDEEVLSKAIDS